MMLSGGSDPAAGEPGPDGAVAAGTGAADWLLPALRQPPLGLPPMGAGSGGGKSPGL